MAATIKYGDTKWAVKDGNTLGYNDENRFKPVPFDFTRNSIGTRVDRNGLIETIGNNIPRIDFTDNTDGHLLLEPQSTNLLTYSEDFSQWTLGSNSTLTYESDVVAPDGSLGVYRLTNPATSSTYIQSPLFTYNNPITLSIYAKYADASNNEFDLYDGTNTTRKITTSEWQRFDAVGFGNQLTIVNSGDTYITDIYIWGGQAEALSYPTSYIPTNGSTVLRASETCTNAGNSTLINSTEGVLYAEIAALADDGTARNMALSDGTTSNRIVMVYTNVSNQIRFYLEGTGGTITVNHTLTNSTELVKAAVRYKSQDFAFYINGVQIDTNNSSITFSGLNDLSFYNPFGGGSSPFYGKCKELAVFDEALTDDELELLTGITNYGSFNELAQANGYTII